MKKLLKKLSCAAILLSAVLTSAYVCAEAEDNIRLFCNGEEIPCSAAPYTENDCTMVNIEVFEALGATVTGYTGSGTTAHHAIIENDSQFICAVRGDDHISVSAKQCPAVSAKYIAAGACTKEVTVDGKTYVFVPLRAVASALGFDMEWNETEKSVNIFNAEPFSLDVQTLHVTHINGSLPVMVSVTGGDPSDTYTYVWSCDSGWFDEIYINYPIWRDIPESAVYTETALYKADPSTLSAHISDHGSRADLKAYVTVINSKGVSVTESIDIYIRPTPHGGVC